MQLAAPPRRARSSPAVLFRHGDALVLILLGLPTAAIDWQIARTWSVPAWISLGLLGLVAMAVVLVIVGAFVIIEAFGLCSTFGQVVPG